MRSYATFVESQTSIETIDDTGSPAEAMSCSGTYSRNGSTITMTTPETKSCVGQHVIGTLTGSTRTLDHEGTTIAFRR